MNMNSVYDKLICIFKKRFGIDFTRFNEECLDKDLLCNDINMQSRDLVYLFLDIQNEFSISIPQDFIAEGKFNTFKNIEEMVTSLCINV